MESSLSMSENRIGGVEQSDSSPRQLESLLNTARLILDYTNNKYQDLNARTAMIMGVYEVDWGKKKKGIIPSKAERSRFSCERYQFFLDAPFEIGKQCCDHLKKAPLKKYQKESGRRPILATMASESRLRTQAWLKNGCNAFDAKDKKSTPMSFWFEQDVLQYIYINKIPINPVYGEVVIDYEGMGQLEGQMRLDNLSPEFGVFDLERPTYKTTGLKRTGCFACGYGMHHEKKEDSRIQGIIDFSNPKLADWMLRGGHFSDKGLWEPYQGCGMWFPLMWCEKYGGLKYYIPNREYYLEKYSTPETDHYLKDLGNT